MAVVKLDALTNLASIIAAAFPSVPTFQANKIAIQQAPSAVLAFYPNIELILPGKLPYEPADRLFQQDLGGGTIVWNVGAFEGPLQIRLTCNTTLERATYEQQLIDLFYQSEHRPGILLAQVTSSDLIQWTAAFEYEDSSWMDVRAQEREYEAILNVNCVVPALATHPNTNVIDTLVLNFAQTFDRNIPPPLPVELVQINQDGSISPFVEP